MLSKFRVNFQLRLAQKTFLKLFGYRYKVLTWTRQFVISSWGVPLGLSSPMPQASSILKTQKDVKWSNTVRLMLSFILEISSINLFYSI